MVYYFSDFVSQDYFSPDYLTIVYVPGIEVIIPIQVFNFSLTIINELNFTL